MHPGIATPLPPEVQRGETGAVSALAKPPLGADVADAPTARPT